MKKVLPILISIVLSFFLFTHGAFSAHAQTPLPTPDVPYSPDPEVNFVGKSAARSIQFLNWTLTNYYWQCSEFNNTSKACDNSNSPLIGFWAIIRNIVYSLFALFVLITAFVLMTTRGRSLTVQRFIPRFVAVILLVTFSYAILQLLYVATDIFQGFFLTKPPDASGALRTISAEDLLYVGWDYESFQGLRKIHPFFDESVFVNLLLARLTAVTYYALTGILIIRKIILWFFIIVSPIFPVLLLYYPVRNTAKIWIGEFFRWLMYGPLFSVFLAGLVSMWSAQKGIPLLFNWGVRDSGHIVYPTATNILLGGPGQKVMINNNLNVPDTFAQYVVALIMLWVVMLLPFVLLQIFLDYLNSFSMNESPAIQKIINTSYSLLNKQTPPPLPPGYPPGSPTGTGMARSLPIAKFGTAQRIPDIRDTGSARALPFAQPIATYGAQAPISTQMLNAASISLPTMRDIAKYETAMLSQQGVAATTQYQSLQKFATPEKIANTFERERVTKIREQVLQQSQSGNPIAQAVLQASNIATNISSVSNKTTFRNTSRLKKTLTQISSPSANLSTVTTTEKDRTTKLHDSLVRESQQGNTLASTLLSTTKETSLNQVQDLRERLVQESMNNSSIATNVLATSMSAKETDMLKTVIQEVSNPQNASVIDRQKVTQMHEALVKESEKGNTLATTILSSKEITSTKDLQQIKEKLVDASLQGDQYASSILSTAITQSDIKSTQTFIQQMANPNAVVNTVDKERFTQIKEKLTQAQQQGNQFATDILTSTSKIADINQPENVKEQEVQKIKEKLLAAKEKGEPIATEMLKAMVGETQTPLNTSLPQSNRVQSVSLEDYESVKKMWQENYRNIDVPEGVTDRKEWITGELDDIDTIIAMLSSENQQTVQEGMQEVSNILPFLMLGGFSQEEIVAYLKAKQEAGKNVLETIVTDESDEDTMISVQKRHATASATMAQAQEVTYTSSASRDGDAYEDGSSLQHVSAQKVTLNAELLQLTNLPMPTMRDVVKLEISLLSKDADTKQQATKVKETLQQIANPETITSTDDRQRIEQVREKLMQNRQQGDIVATTILTAASKLSGKPIRSTTQTKEQLTHIIAQLANPQVISFETDRQQIIQLKERLLQEQLGGNQTAGTILAGITAIAESDSMNAKTTLLHVISPESITDEASKVQFVQAHELLVQESQTGNTLAATILSINETTSQEDIQKVKETIVSEKSNGNKLASEVSTLIEKTTDAKAVEELQQKIVIAQSQGDPLAASIIALARGEGEESSGLPQTNRMQTVSLEDYEAIRQMWSENYKNLEVPVGASDRTEWISQEIQSIDQIVRLLSSPNQDEVQKGMEQVSNILPFLLLGGFSQDEIVAYLKAKEEAGKSVLQAIEDDRKNEETLVAVPVQASSVPAVASFAATAMPSVIETHEIIEHFDRKETQNANEKPVDKLTDQVKISELIPLLQSLNIQVPSLQDVARYEKTLQAKEKERKESIIKVLQMLRYLVNPEEMHDEEDKEKLRVLKSMLRKQRSKGDALAGVILKAMLSAADKENQFSPAQLSHFRSYLQRVINIEQASTPSANKEYTLMYEALVQESQRGNQLARRLFSFSADDVVIPEVRQLKEQLLSELQEGNEVASIAVCLMLMQMEDAPLEKYLASVLNRNTEDRTFDKEKMQELRILLEREHNAGNEFAATILAVDEHDNQAKANAISQLVQQSKEGNKLAKQIVHATFSVQDIEKIRSAIVKMLTAKNVVGQQQVSEIADAFQREQKTGSTLAAHVAQVNDKTTDTELLSLRENLIGHAGNGDVFAMKLIQQLPEDIQEMGDDSNTTVLFPEANTIQTVSLDDYEAVKAMWEENYEKADLPETETDRKEWLKHENATCEALLTDLTSGDEQRAKNSMQHVANILPFLLLGGFSREEVVAYVKAKAQAANAISQRLARDTQEGEFVSSTGDKPQVMAMQSADIPTSEQS